MDFRAKQQVIENIEDEVNELHPLLLSLLAKLQNIRRAEYTHGPNEKGADFVLTRFDPALSTSSYVGVIAKVGKIQQDISEIERQIDECALKRKINGGKDEVRLSEIWVINTSRISNNAKDKIYDKFSKQRIEFIDGEQLARLVDQHAPYFWYHIPSSVGSYLQNLNARLQQMDRELDLLGDLGCESFYIEPDIQEIEKVTYQRHIRPKKPRYVNLAEEAKREPVLVIEADMGFGKSKTVRALALSYCAEDRFKYEKVVPIFMSYKQYVEKYASVLEALKGELGALYEEAQNKQYHILMILDGLDEAASDKPDWQSRLKSTITEVRQVERLNVVLTSRPIHQLDESFALYQGAKQLLLRPLSVQKLIQFISKACEKQSLPKKLFEDLQKSDLFKQLPQSPIAAALLSRLLAQNQQDLPANLTELYAKALELMLGRWDVQKKTATEKEFLVASRATLQIADYMLRNRLIWISAAEARQIVQDWHSKRNTGIDLDTLLRRVFDKNSVFAHDDELNTITFRHRSFGEFLYSKHLLSSQVNLEMENAFDPYWIVVHFFHLGLLGDCPKHLTDLMATVPPEELGQWLKVLVMPDYFLAAYQTEYRLVEDNLYKLFLEAANLYTRIRRGETKTRLIELSEMHLLWFFQRLIRNNYDYEFFRQAITPTILKLEQELVDEDVKLIALFFASCYAAELGDGSGFEFLVKTYGTEKLPVSLSLAIKLEQETNKQFSKLPILKAHDKKLRLLLGSKKDEKAVDTIAQNKVLRDLFEVPLKAKLQRKMSDDRTKNGRAQLPKNDGNERV